MGATASLAKPFEVDELVALVRSLLEAGQRTPRSTLSPRTMCGERNLGTLLYCRSRRLKVRLRGSHSKPRAALRQKPMNDTRVFEEGYKEGWRLIKGPDVSGLTVPACELTRCCSPYREGLTRGMEDAARHQSERSNRDAPPT